eukprot:1571989-Alexandrium_andersonii.AAC.1
MQGGIVASPMFLGASSQEWQQAPRSAFGVGKMACISSGRGGVLVAVHTVEQLGVIALVAR